MRFQIFMVAIAIASSSASAGPPSDGLPYGGGTRLRGPAPAEIPTGPMSKQDKARIATLRFAECLIKSRRAAALSAIALDPWDANATGKLTSIADARCLELGELAMPASLLRGAFYQVLYREKFWSGQPALPPVAIDFAATAGANATDDVKTEIALRQFGDCVVRRDLEDAHALLLSTPGTKAETIAVEGLMPHFAPCVIQGAKWTLNRANVTAILSEVLYRDGTAARQQASK